jgi:glycerol-3-phosphate acyltransferase PlsY
VTSVSGAGLLVFSYLAGSLPIGLWAGFLKGVDVRTVGSGNIGATNIVRTLGWKTGAAVFAGDTLKGFAPVAIARYAAPGLWGGMLPVFCGALALAGHMSSPFLRFRGGRGVATGLGVYLGLAPLAALSALGLWAVVVAVVRIVSVASVLAAVSCAPFMRLYGQPAAYFWFAVAVAAIVAVKHWPNFKRLVRGQEPRWGRKA